MSTSYAMMASSVTLLAEDERVEVDEVVEAGGAAICVQGCLSLSCALLCQTVAASMAHMKVK